MEPMRIPKFENEADEANWAYEDREELAAAFLHVAHEGLVRLGTPECRSGPIPPRPMRTGR